jgi:hypothetical protein
MQKWTERVRASIQLFKVRERRNSFIASLLFSQFPEFQPSRKSAMPLTLSRRRKNKGRALKDRKRKRKRQTN